jgi:hypothetical protein
MTGRYGRQGAQGRTPPRMWAGESRSSGQSEQSQITIQQESSPGLQESSPGLQESSPGLQESSPGLQESSPGLQKSSPGLQESSPGLQESSPGLQESSPSLQESPPGLQETHPAGSGTQMTQAKRRQAAHFTAETQRTQRFFSLRVPRVSAVRGFTVEPAVQSVLSAFYVLGESDRAKGASPRKGGKPPTKGARPPGGNGNQKKSPTKSKASLIHPGGAVRAAILKTPFD